MVTSVYRSCHATHFLRVEGQAHSSRKLFQQWTKIEERVKQTNKQTNKQTDTDRQTDTPVQGTSENSKLQKR